MTGAERARARAMPPARARAGDTVDLDGLRFAGDAATVAALGAAGGPTGERFDAQRRGRARPNRGGAGGRRCPASSRPRLARWP